MRSFVNSIYELGSAKYALYISIGHVQHIGIMDVYNELSERFQIETTFVTLSPTMVRHLDAAILRCVVAFYVVGYQIDGASLCALVAHAAQTIWQDLCSNRSISISVQEIHDD